MSVENDMRVFNESKEVALAVYYRLCELARASRMVGLDGQASQLQHLADKLYEAVEQMDFCKNGILNELFNSARESSMNMLAAALAVCEIKKEE